MSYKVVDISNGSYKFIDLPDGSVITCNNKQYKISGGNIFCYEMQDDGKFSATGAKVNEITLSGSQISLFSQLDDKDNYTDRFDRNDLSDLSRKDLNNTLKDVYGDTILINHSRVRRGSVSYEIEPDYDNGFERTWKNFTNFFRRTFKKEELPIIERQDKDIVRVNLAKTHKNKRTVKVLRHTSNQYNYRVRKDDTIESISLYTDVPAKKIIDANPQLWEMEPLEVGKKLKLPNDAEGHKRPKYEVKEGDTWESIAKAFDISLDELKAVNKNKRNTVRDISDGDVLKIPETKHKTKVKEVNVETIPDRTYIADAKITPQKLANDNGISMYRLINANPNLIIRDKNGNPKLDKNGNVQYREISAGDEIIIPMHKNVTRLNDLSIRAIAEEVGISETYIRDILFGIEGRHMKPDLIAYDDMVAPINPDGTKMTKEQKDARLEKGWAIGTPTIGFGHTGRVHGIHMGRNSNYWQDVTITEEEAYLLLANDLYSAKQDAIAYFGDDFTRAPQSIQDAIVDIIFNKGINGFKRKPCCDMAEYLASGDYVAAATNAMVDPTIPGLRKRNTYRVMLATKDLTDKQRQQVLDNIEEYKDETITRLMKNPNNAGDVKKLRADWELARGGQSYGYFV